MCRPSWRARRTVLRCDAACGLAGSPWTPLGRFRGLPGCRFGSLGCGFCLLLAFSGRDLREHPRRPEINGQQEKPSKAKKNPNQDLARDAPNRAGPLHDAKGIIRRTPHRHEEKNCANDPPNGPGGLRLKLASAAIPVHVFDVETSTGCFSALLAHQLAYQCSGALDRGAPKARNLAPQQKTPHRGGGALLGLLQGGEICISIYVDPWEVGRVRECRGRLLWEATGA